jgi:Type IV secretion-system coupling protein DNA-binding domain
MASIHEQLTSQFYKWESRGRGWRVFDGPVCPEPPFQVFNGYRLPETPVVDDGRVPTLLSSLFRKISQPPLKPVIPEEPEPEPEPTPLVRESLVEFQASLPADLDVGRESFDQFFHNLALCREPIAFELLGIHKRVIAQFAASTGDAPAVRRQLSSHFPEVQFRQLEGALDKAWEGSAGDETFAVEFGLEQEFMWPLATGKIDPFVGLVGALAELQPGELALFQVLWQPVQNPWAESLVNSVTLPDGQPLFVNAPELVGAAENKVGRPLYAAVVRILVRTATTSRLQEIARELAGSLRVFINPQGNALIPLHNEDYPFEEHINDVLSRQSRRSGMILNSDELVGFVHLPSSAVRSPALVRDSGRTKAASDIVQRRTGILIGDNEHNGETVAVYLTPEQRVRHTHIIGSNGTGKSSLLLNMIRQDIENRDGVAVLDPHGDLIDQILGCIPEDRINDVVLVDLSDEDFPIGFNLLHAHSEIEKRLLASDLVGVFRRLSTTWGDQMDTVLQNAILAFLKSSQGGTLADLRRFLRDEKFRSDFLLTVRDVEVLTFWQEIFPQLGGGKSVSSLLARLQEFFSQEPLRNMVSQRKSVLNFEDIMDSGKIFLAKLSTGLGGEENSYLLGTLLVSKFQQLAMARQAQKIEARRDFWLYIDEFQNFISPSMEKILTGARKYRLGFTLAHQNLHQLQDNAKVASAVMTQPCTRIVLQVGDDDAKKLGECFDSFDGKSLTRLEKFHAIVRVERNDFDFNLALRKPELPGGGEERRAAVIAASREKYAAKRADVEAMLLAEVRPVAGQSKLPEPPASADGSSKPKPKPISPPAGTPKIIPPAESPKVTEVPKTAMPPTMAKNPPATDSEKENLELSPVEPGSTAQSEEGADLENKSEHDALKDEIQTHAESLDYTVARETPIPEHGRPDLILTRGNHSIACEISVTTHKTIEADHIRLRLKAGFTHVAVISQNRRKLPKIEATYLKLIPGASLDKVGFYSRDEFLNQLSTWAMDDHEGGAQERAKPRKQNLGTKPPPQNPVEQAQVQRALLADLQKMMARDRKK